MAVRLNLKCLARHCTDLYFSHAAFFLDNHILSYAEQGAKGLVHITQDCVWECAQQARELWPAVNACNKAEGLQWWKSPGVRLVWVREEMSVRTRDSMAVSQFGVGVLVISLTEVNFSILSRKNGWGTGQVLT